VRLISGSLADGFRNDSELEEVAALKPSRELPKTLRLDELTVYEEY